MRKHAPIDKMSDYGCHRSNSANKMIMNIARTGVAAAVTVSGIFAVYKFAVGRNDSADSTFLAKAGVVDFCEAAGKIEYYFDVNGNVSYEISILVPLDYEGVETVSYEVVNAYTGNDADSSSAFNITVSDSMSERTDLYALLSNDVNDGFACASLTYMLKDVQINVEICYEDGSVEADTLGLYAKNYPATAVAPDGNEIIYETNGIFCYSIGKADADTKKFIDDQISGSWIYLNEDGAPAADPDATSEPASNASSKSADTSADDTSAPAVTPTAAPSEPASVPAAPTTSPDAASEPSQAPAAPAAEPAENAEDPTIGSYVYDCGMFWIPEFDEFYQYGNDYDVGLVLPRSGKTFDIDKGEENEVGYAEYIIRYGEAVLSIGADCIIDNAIIETSEDSIYLILILGQGGDVEETVVYEFADGDAHEIERYDHTNYNFSHLK